MPFSIFLFVTLSVVGDFQFPSWFVILSVAKNPIP